MKNRLAVMIYVVCFLSLPATWIILEAGSGPSYIVYSISSLQTRRAAVLAEHQPWNPFERPAYEQAVTLWTAAANLCETTPDCHRVQIEGEVLPLNGIANVKLVVYGGERGAEVTRSTEFQSERYSGRAVSRASAVLQASGDK